MLRRFEVITSVILSSPPSKAASTDAHRQQTHAPGRRPRARPAQARRHVELDWDVRQKSRFDTTDSQGRQIGVFLPRGTAVRGGDVLVAEDGSLIKVIAAPQPVLVITHCSEHGTPFDLMRAAYHLGNRHVPIELKPDHLKIEPDHVLAGMLRSMHLIVREADEAFEPEGGAYGAHGAATGIRMARRRWGRCCIRMPMRARSARPRP